MATAAEIRAGLDDYVSRCNANTRLRKMLKGWTRCCVFTATDAEAAFTVTITAGEITAVQPGAAADADLVIAASSEDLADMFWGDLNPAAKYVTGDIAVRGSAEDVLRVDAMASLIWVDA